MPVQAVNNNEGSPPQADAHQAANDWQAQQAKERAEEQAQAARQAAEEAARQAAKQAADQAARNASARQDAKPASLLTDDPSSNPANCLTQAVTQASPGDNVVFLADSAAASKGVGHVVDINNRTGIVTDPEALDGSKMSKNLTSYIAETGASGHHFSLAASAPAAEVQHILALPKDQRAAAISSHDPNLASIENTRFDDQITSIASSGNGNLAVTVTPGSTSGGTQNAAGAGAAAQVLPTLTVIGTDSGGRPASAGVSGGIWTAANQATLAALGAAPNVPANELTNSAADAEQLASGTKVQSLLSSGQSTAAIDGAYELLGISNRQLSAYAKAAAQGGVGKNQQIFGTLTYTPTGASAFTALKQAAQMRAASSTTGAQDIELGGHAPAVWSPEPGVVPLPQPRAGTLPAGLGFQGMYDAVDQGVSSANTYSFPSFVADGMLYGSGGIYINKAISASNSAFGGHDPGSATAAIGNGQSLLSSSAVTLAATGSISGVSPTAVATLSTLSTTQAGAWTPQAVTEAIYAADSVFQSEIPTIRTDLQAAQAQLGTAAGTQSASQAASLQRSVVDQALTKSGVSGITAAGIANTLVSAAASPAFAQATAGSQQSADTAYTVMSSFDPQSLQHLGLLEKYGNPASGVPLTATQAQNRKLLAPYLTMMSTTPLPQPSASLTDQQKVNAGLTAGAWSTASLRWFTDASQKLGMVWAKNVAQQQLATYGKLIAQSVQNAQVSVGLTVNPSAANPVSASLLRFPTTPGQFVNSMQDVRVWAAQQSGLGSAPVIDYLENAESSTSQALNTYIAGPLAVVQFGTRMGQIATSNTTMDIGTNSAYAFADAASIASWASNPDTVGTSLVRGLANVGDKFNNLAAWAGLADAAPQQIQVDPGSPLAKFTNGVFQHGGTTALLTYGGLNMGLGIRTIAQGQVTQGSMQTLAGALDFGQGLVQLVGATNPDLAPAWTNINGYGYSLPSTTLIAARFIAGGNAIPLAILAGLNG